MLVGIKRVTVGVLVGPKDDNSVKLPAASEVEPGSGVQVGGTKAGSSVAVGVWVSGMAAAMARVGTAGRELVDTAVSGAHAASSKSKNSHRKNERTPPAPFRINRSYHRFPNQPMLASPCLSATIRQNIYPYQKLFMSIYLVLKLLLVLVALIFFLRRPNFVWGIGLLSVTTAVLLDTFLGTFNREAVLADLGFFFYIISGVLFAGATLWAWGILWPLLGVSTNPVPISSSNNDAAAKVEKKARKSSAAFDRQMLYDEIRQRLGRQDVLDLIFDLGLNENDVMMPGQDMNQLIINIMDQAEENGQSGALALAVERILTPPPPENLPRLEKIDAASPATILRHYLLAHFNLAQLQDMASNLEIDWDELDAGNKKTKVRSLLLYLYRRNRIHTLIAYLRPPATSDEEE